jgi:ketosteroid isomerase-like protein
MKRTLVAVLMTTAFVAFSQTVMSAGYYQGNNQRNIDRNTQRNDDEATLKELVRDWANAVVQRDFSRMDRIQAAEFKGSAQGISFNPRMLKAALQSQELSISGWTVEDVKVRITGNTAVVTGRSMLTNAKYKGMDFSGAWDWSDRFIKQKDGSWRAVSSQARMVKKQ